MSSDRSNSKYFILNYVFLLSLLCLIINDHLLKAEFGNLVTGKLSDIAGIIILPLLIAFLFPRIRHYSIWVSTILFTLWKSPFSQPVIDLYNEFAIWQTSRVVDYSDLVVLVLLPIPYYLIKNVDRVQGIHLKRANAMVILLPTMLSLMATSPPEKHYYTRTDGNLACYGCNIQVHNSQEEIVKKLADHNIKFESITPIDSNLIRRFPHFKTENIRHYKLKQLIVDKDTLRNLDFTMKENRKNQTKIYFNGMEIKDSIPNQKLEIKLRNFYRKLLFSELQRLLYNPS